MDADLFYDRRAARESRATNWDLYTWDIEEFYASLITPEDGETWGDVPWMNDEWIAENTIECV